VDTAWQEQVAKETIIGMLVNPENTPSVAEGTAVQEAAAAIEPSV
jgi:hypothetical protein